MTEQWKTIQDFEEYAVSNHGRVARIVGKRRILKVGIVGGYRRVNLYKSGKAFSRKIARLVAQAFIPNPLGLPEVNHIKNPKTNDHVSNLEWMTHSQQIKHAVDNSLYHRGSQLSHHKLTTKDVLKIQQLGAAGTSNRAVAAIYGVHRSTIESAIKGMTWKHAAASASAQ